MDFREYHPLEEFLQAQSADSVSLATAAGSINHQLDCGMLLRVEALHVPDFGASLLSVPQLIKDGIDVSFRSHSRTAYITSEDFTEQPLGRCAPGSMSFVLLGNVTSKRSHANATAHRANDTPRSYPDSDSAPRSDSDSASRADSDSTPRVEVSPIWKETPAGTIFGRDLEWSPTGSGWKRNQWILQIRCPTGKPLRTRGLARNGRMRLMRNSDLRLKTQPRTTSGWKTFQPASRPLAPSGSSRPRSCQEAAFGITPGLLSEVLNSRRGLTSMKLSLR